MKEKMRYIDLTGQKFGRLTVIESAEKQEKGKSHNWICECECGNQIVVPAHRLKNGTTKSCGCLLKENANVRLAKHRKKTKVEGTDLDALTNKPRKDNTTGVRGVYWIPEKGKYRTKIIFKGKVYELGYYETLEEAAAVRAQAEKRLWDPIKLAHNYKTN